MSNGSEHLDGYEIPSGFPKTQDEAQAMAERVLASGQRPQVTIRGSKRESSTLDGATTEPEPGVESNPGEFAVVWNRHTEEERAEMLRTMRVWRDRGERCWREDHERQVAEQRSRIAALEAVIQRATEALVVLQTVDGWVDPITRARAIAKARETLSAAPSTVLDGMIREAKAEAWDEGASDGQWNAEHEAMIARGNREAITNPYRNGGA